jgi:2-dehydropantoate 2-reductase
MKIAIFGAGSVGAYVGGSLIASGADVVLIGRARMQAQIERHGLVLTDLHDGRRVLDAAQISYTQDPAALKEADLILVTVKSADTAQAAAAIQQHAQATALVISLQNGVGNAEVLSQALPHHTVLAGMVPFNVVALPEGRLHRGTEGDIGVQASPALAQWQSAFEAAGIPLQAFDNFEQVQWGKLLLNLNNPVNALSGLPLKAELSQRAYRQCLALLISETLMVLQRAGIEPAKVARIGPKLLPWLLRLPDFLFVRVAAAMLRIDEEARSSMWDDLHLGRRTEVDYLNGAVVKLAHSLGLQAPANERIIALIRQAEAGQKTAYAGEALLSAITPGPRSAR